MVITPEGTRKLAKQWKKGYYHIAMKASVIVIPGFLDYSQKVGGTGEPFFPSGDYDRDFAPLEQFYRTKVAKYPGNFNLSQK
jgi:1-acyl-sn-glycerol-3-phosphate acyltransferase